MKISNIFFLIFIAGQIELTYIGSLDQPSTSCKLLLYLISIGVILIAWKALKQARSERKD